MWLINCRSHPLTLVQVKGRIPDYAILSHTWGSDEVTFQDFSDIPKRTTQEGFQKIQKTCRQAVKDGLQYAWVDTCCIDKTSSAELSEAINSMFQWYRDAAKCYVYLADYHDEERYRGQKVPFCREVFANSRWFTRGWTLQELLAPSDITFYTSTWAYLGTKKRSVDLLSEITGIDKLALEGWPLHTFSVAERMSWAGDRETSRPEDIAYCLMGIFDVNMPMIYGEGHKAFTRLQEEILKRCEDQTLFAWMASPEDAQRAPYRGLLAKSPSEFKRVLSSAGRMVPFYSVSASPIPVAATSRGIPLTSRVEEVPGSDRKMIFLGLNCHPENSRNHFIEIKLVCLGGDRYLRADPEELAMNETAIARAAAKTATVYVATSVEVSDDELLRQMVPPGIQHSFFIDTMPSEDIAVWSVMPHSGHTVRINGSLGKSGAWIPPERWVDDKTALVFVAPGSNTVLLVVLWVVPQAAGQFIQPFFTAEVRTSEYRQDVEVINNKERPAESVSRRIVSGQFPGPEEKTMAVTIERAKHFGHDVFCLDVTTISAKGSESPKPPRRHLLDRIPNRREQTSALDSERRIQLLEERLNQLMRDMERRQVYPGTVAPIDSTLRGLQQPFLPAMGFDVPFISDVPFFSDDSNGIGSEIMRADAPVSPDGSSYGPPERRTSRSYISSPAPPEPISTGRRNPRSHAAGGLKPDLYIVPIYDMNPRPEPASWAQVARVAGRRRDPGPYLHASTDQSEQPNTKALDNGREPQRPRTRRKQKASKSAGADIGKMAVPLKPQRSTPILHRYPSQDW